MNPHYEAIKNHYGTRTAQRSGVPLINHINEGIAVLLAIGAPQVAIDAFCIHPLLQDDDELAHTLMLGTPFTDRGLDPRAIVYAMEYRRVANNYLSKHCHHANDFIDLSHLAPVNQMLVADKVQNRKDFERYHRGTHPKSATLELYFDNWLDRLSISEAQYAELCSIMDGVGK